MGYHIKLDLFEGPLDLLLHLISKAKIKIEEVSIAEVTEQYLDYLDKMKEFNVEIASEFLVMAANLLYIKSRALLPRPKPQEDEESDPEQDLLRRLSEYKKYKEASLKLREREAIYSNIYYRLPEEIIDKKESSLLALVEGAPVDLLEAFVKALEKKPFQRTGERVYPVKKHTITIDQKIRELKRVLYLTPQCSFSELIDNQQGRIDIIITFLALLEMLKNNQVFISQEARFEDIIIRRATQNNG